MNDQEFEESKTRIIAHVRLRPGLRLTAVPTLLGWNNSDRAGQKAGDLVARLEQEGEISIVDESAVYPYKRLFTPHDRPATMREPAAPKVESSIKKRVRKVATAQNKKALAVAEKGRRFNEALDHLIEQAQPFTITDIARIAGLDMTGIYRPVYRSIKERADKAIAQFGRSAPIHCQTTANLRRLQDTLSKLIESGSEFTLQSWADQAGVSNSSMNNKAYAELRHQAQLHLAQQKVLDLQPDAAEVKELKQKIADLEQRNRELRQTISEALPQSSTPAQPPQEWLRAQVQFWKAKEAQIEEELEQLLLDLNAVQNNLSAAERLLSLEDDAETSTPTLSHV